MLMRLSLVFPAVSCSPIHCFDLVARDNLCLLFRSNSWLLSAVVERRDLDSILNLLITDWFDFLQKKFDGTKVYHIFRICCMECYYFWDIISKKGERIVYLVSQRNLLSWKDRKGIMRGSVVSVRYWNFFFRILVGRK